MNAADLYTPILGPNGEVEAIAGTTREVTEHKRAEDEIRKLKAELEQRIQMSTADLQRLTVQLSKLAKDLTPSDSTPPMGCMTICSNCPRQRSQEWKACGKTPRAKSAAATLSPC